jgi:hypothetical protein
MKTQPVDSVNPGSDRTPAFNYHAASSIGASLLRTASCVADTVVANGFLIDPILRRILPHAYNGDYKSIYTAIHCTEFALAEFDIRTRDGVFVDDNGLLNRPHFFFSINGYPQLLAGKGLVLGTDAEGETVSPAVSLETLVRNVKFYELFTRNAKTGKLMAFQWDASRHGRPPLMVALDDAVIEPELVS